MFLLFWPTKSSEHKKHLKNTNTLKNLTDPKENMDGWMDSTMEGTMDG